MSEGSALRDDAPTTLPMQPIPLDVHIARDYHAGGCTTALVRIWRPDEIPACRLCPIGKCKAHSGVCLVQVQADVPDEQATFYSTIGFRWASEGPRVRPENVGFTDLDRVVIPERSSDLVQKHLPKALGRAAF